MDQCGNVPARKLTWKNQHLCLMRYILVVLKRVAAVDNDAIRTESDLFDRTLDTHVTDSSEKHPHGHQSRKGQGKLEK